MTVVNPNTSERRESLNRRKPQHKHKPGRLPRPIDPRAHAALDGLQLALEEATSYGVVIRVARLAGIGQKLDGWHVTFYWRSDDDTHGVAGRNDTFIASWYPTTNRLHLAGTQKAAATIYEALGKVLKVLDVIVKYRLFAL